MSFRVSLFLSRDLDCTITVLSSTYESSNVLSATACMWYSFIAGAMYKADKTGERAKPWPTPTSA